MNVIALSFTREDSGNWRSYASVRKRAHSSCHDHECSGCAFHAATWTSETDAGLDMDACVAAHSRYITGFDSFDEKRL